MIAQGLNALKQALVGSGATKPSTAHEAQPGTDGDQDEDFDLEEVDHMETEEPERDQALTKTPAAEGKKGRGKKAGPSKWVHAACCRLLCPQMMLCAGFGPCQHAGPVPTCISTALGCWAEGCMAAQDGHHVP